MTIGPWVAMVVKSVANQINVILYEVVGEIMVRKV